MACGNCGRAKDKHVEGLLGRLGCYNTSGSTTYEPTAPSTPAPQGEKCAHAPEIPEREQVFMRTGLIRVMYDAGKMDDYLVRERESRQQAEAALAFFLDDPRVDVAVGGNPHYIDRRYAEIRAAYPERPIPQEPAERERGK